MVHTDPTLVDLTISGDKLETTPQHPFYVDGKGWVNAGDLVVGDHIRRADGTDGTVEAIKVVQRQQVMYNLTVDVAHTFFVGDKHFLVHNTDEECPRFRLLPDKNGIIISDFAIGEIDTKTHEIDLIDGVTRYASNFGVKPEGSFFDVVGHGNGYGITYPTSNEFDEVAIGDIIMALKEDWKPVRLVVCDAGCTPPLSGVFGKQPPFAQKLANYIKAQVLAPTDAVYLSPTRNLKLEPGSKWLLFSPNDIPPQEWNEGGLLRRLFRR